MVLLVSAVPLLGTVLLPTADALSQVAQVAQVVQAPGNPGAMATPKGHYGHEPLFQCRAPTSHAMQQALHGRCRCRCPCRESVVMLRKLALTAVSVFLGAYRDEAVLLVAMGIVCIAMMAQVGLSEHGRLHACFFHGMTCMGMVHRSRWVHVGAWGMGACMRAFSMGWYVCRGMV